MLSLLAVRADLMTRFAFNRWRSLLLVLLSLTLLNKNIWKVYILPPALTVFFAGMKDRLLLLVHFIIASTNLVRVERLKLYLTPQPGKKIGTKLNCSSYLLTESEGGYRFIAK